MKLSTSQSRVLACAELDAGLSISQIARRAGVKPTMAGHYLRSLGASGAIRRTALLDLQSAGYRNIGIFFSVAAQHGKDPQRFVSNLMRNPRVTWAAEYGGDFQYGLALCVKDIFEVRSLLEELAAQNPGLLFEKSVVHQFSLLVCGHGMLAGPRFRGRALQLGATGDPHPLDSLDQRILGEMTRTPFESRRQIAATLKVPSQTVDLRIKKLEAAKVIAGYIYELDSSHFGLHSHTLLVYCKGIASQLRAQIFEFSAAHPAITHCFECLGNWDFELYVEVEEPRAVVQVMQELYRRFGSNINTVKTLIQYRQLKSTQVPFT